MTITTRAWSASRGTKIVRARIIGSSGVCSLLIGFAGVMPAQIYAPATAPPSPADMIRQSTAVQSFQNQSVPGQNLPIAAEGGSLPISAGDVVDVQVFATPELSGSSRVDQNGEITLPVGGRVRLSGLTPAQAAMAVEAQLKSAQIMLNPLVRVFTVQYAAQGVTVLGEVARPGTYTLLGVHTLWDALSAAAGLTTNAGKSITIAHHGDPTHPDVIPLSSPNYSAILDTTPVSPGDSVVVSRADNFYVVGDVGRTGEFPLINGRPNTILNALALCGGANRTAKMTKVSIVRTTATGVETIPLNLNLIMKNAAPNIVLQASDVLVVPRSGQKVFFETVLANATQTVTSAVISALIVR
jgi:polysaccharide export outer membrane protein